MEDREIQAAKLRVAAANRMMEAAHALMETARREVEDAVAFLRETKERLGATDIDDVDYYGAPTNLGGSKKRQKMSTPSSRRDTMASIDPTELLTEFQEAVNKHRDQTLVLLKQSNAMGEASVPMNKILPARMENRGYMLALNRLVIRVGGEQLTESDVTRYLTQAESEAEQLYVTEMKNATQSTAESTETIEIVKNIPTSNDKDQPGISVTGCGILEVNGNYTRSMTEVDGAPTYRKEGTRRGRDVTFIIYRKNQTKGSKYWLLGVADSGGPSQILYKSPANEPDNPENDGTLPPTSGWAITGGGIGPPPTLRHYLFLSNAK